MVKTEPRVCAIVVPSDAVQFVNGDPENDLNVFVRQRHYLALPEEAEDLRIFAKFAARVYGGLAVFVDIEEYIALDIILALEIVLVLEAKFLGYQISVSLLPSRMEERHHTLSVYD